MNIHPPLRFGVIGLEHVHAGEMTRGLVAAGAHPVWVHSEDDSKAKAFLGEFPSAARADTADRIIGEATLGLIVCATVPDARAPLATLALRSGKNVLSAKPFGTTLGQLAEARRVTEETGRRVFIYFSERVNVRSSLMAGEIASSGRLGEIVQVLCLAPHRLGRSGRPAWFFDPTRSGGILTDIGSHQFDQILSFGGMQGARVTHAFTANRSVPEHPRFEDYGEASVIGDNGVAGFTRVDWLTPDGLGVWGDVRTIILGTKGTLEIRKYTDIAREGTPDHLYLVDGSGEHHLRPDPGMPLPFFGDVVRDCHEGSENATPREHGFLAMELALRAQEMAESDPVTRR